MAFEEVGSRYDGPKLEQDVLEFWRREDVFERSQQASEGRPLYVWNEGPGAYEMLLWHERVLRGLPAP